MGKNLSAATAHWIMTGDEEVKEAGQDLLDNMLDYMLEKVMPLGSRVVRGLSYL